MSNQDPQYVTHAEFSSFKENTEASLGRLEKMMQRALDQQKFPVGIVLTMLGMAAAAVLYVSTSQTGPLANEFERHIAQDGHPVAMNNHARMEEIVNRIDGDVAQAHSAISALDTSLQREMRDLDAVQATRLDGLDDRLQREMRDLTRPLEDRVGFLEADHNATDLIRFNMPDYERLVAPRLADLEHKMDGVRESRFTGATGLELMQRLAVIEAFVSRIQNEQDYRRPKVRSIE